MFFSLLSDNLSCMLCSWCQAARLSPLHIPLSVHNLVASPSTSTLAACDSPIVLGLGDWWWNLSVERAAVEMKTFITPGLEVEQATGSSHVTKKGENGNMHLLAGVHVCARTKLARKIITTHTNWALRATKDNGSDNNESYPLCIYSTGNLSPPRWSAAVAIAFNSNKIAPATNP